MFEPTDASKCDERQVKKKANRLTQKRKGETRTMSIRGTKHWQLGLFFVISLMLVVGVFADSAIAQQKVTVSPTTAKSGDLLSTVRVEYRVQQRITGGNAIIIALPDDWEHAYGTGFGDFADLKSGGFTSRPSPIPAGQTAATTSYVTVSTPYTKAAAAALTAGLSGTAVTVTVVDPGTAGDDAITMVPGNTIIVTFHKVKVKDLVEADYPVTTPPTPGDRMPVDTNVSVSDNRGTVTIDRSTNPDTYTYASTTVADYNSSLNSRTVIKVSPPKLSDITIVDKTAKSGEVRDVTVHYRVRAAMIDTGNTIVITLPDDWENAYGGGDGFGDFADLKNGDFTSLPATLPAGQTEAMTSYVTVSTPYTKAAAAALTAGLSGTAVTVTVVDPGTAGDDAITMKAGDRISVTFHKVEVKHLLETDYPATVKPDSRAAVKMSLTVTDSILRSGYEEGSPVVTKSHYAADLIMTVSPPTLSKVTVVPRTVKAEEMRDTVTATYTVKDMLYAEGIDSSNVITINLPDGWTHAKEDDDFIDGNFLIDLGASTRVSKVSSLPSPLPSDKKASDFSYVTVEYAANSKVKNTANVDVSSTTVTITVNGNMMAEEKITVIYSNVKVQEETGPAQLTITDSIIRSSYTDENGVLMSHYNADSLITVGPPTQSVVRIVPNTVKSEQELDTVRVTYEMEDPKLGSNRVEIGLPDGWKSKHDDGFGSIENIVLTAGANKMTRVSSLPSPLPVGETASTLSYVTVSYSAARDSKATGAAVIIEDYAVIVNVSGDMAENDKITVTFHNVMVEKVMEGDEGKQYKSAYFTVGDLVVDSDYEAASEVKVSPPPPSSVTVTPTTVQASTVRDVTVTYVITDAIAGNNDIVIRLPYGWEAAYANNGDSAATIGSFGDEAKGGTAGDQDIDVDGTKADSANNVKAVAAVRMVTSLPKTLAEDATKAKASYVEVTYTPRGASMNTAIVTISGNEVIIPVKGNMAARDRIVVKYHNVMVPALEARTPMDANITVTDVLSPDGDAYDGMAKIRVNPPPSNTVAVTPDEVMAETIRDVVKVTYSIKGTVLGETNTITVGLPDGWGPAYLPNDESSRSKSFGNFVGDKAPSANRNNTSYVVVTSRGLTGSGDKPDYTVSGLDLSEQNVSLTIDVGETAKSGNNIAVAFYNVKVRGLTTGDTVVPAKDMLTVRDTIAGGTTFDKDRIIEVSPLKRGRITGLPTMVTAEDELDLRIRYTATDDLADLDPDGDEDTADATYGRIQIMLPEGWTPAADTVTAKGSSTVKFSGDDDDPTTPYKPTVEGRLVTINVDSLKDGKYVDITAKELMVAEFPAGMEGKDKIYVRVKVLSDSFDSATDRTTLDVPAAHLSSRFAPTVAPVAATATAAAYGSNDHPTITVNRKYLGEVAVTPASVVAEATTDVKVRYTATNTLADSSDSDAVTAGVQATSFGRVQITLPEGWGPAPNDDGSDGEIHLSRQTDNRNATYLSLRKSSGVTAADLSEDSFELNGDRYRIDIDVDAMRLRQWVELTVHNLMIAPLNAERAGGFDPDITAVKELVQVEVFSETFSVVSNRDAAPELMSPMAHSPVKGKFTPLVAAKDKGSDTQPTLTVTRKQLGKVAISPAKVSAGSAQKFTITYTASEMLVENSVIEVRLPNWGGDDHSGVPTAYQLEDTLPKADTADGMKPHVYLSGSKSRLEDSTVTVQEDGNTSIVRIVLGEKGLAKNNSVALKFEGVTVQRQIAEKVLIEVFSSDSVDLGVPQYPVEKPEEDKIEVTHAADGSGTVTFMFDGEDVKAFVPKTKVADRTKPENHANTDHSVPAGLKEGDTRDLIVTYMPEGDMVGESGTAEFQITLPGNWQAEDVRSSGSDVSRSGNTITAKFKNHFGETDDSLEIFLEDITVPSDHGNDRFVAKSRNAKGNLKQLNPVPMVFVGNTLADTDTMSVEIDPLAAYEGEEDVDFEITLTANGPMHNSDIQITVPDGIEGLQTGESGDPNYVRKVAPSGSGVVVRVDDANDENIFITTGKLNKGGTIIVRLNNVDIDGDVSTDNATGFRVSTRTRGTDDDAADGDDGDKHNLTAVDWALIEKDDGKRSIVGGEIRTITGSGAIAFKPATVQQGSRNVDFDFTFTASTAFSNKTLEIAAPSVIETPLKETAGDGQVTVSGGRYHSDVAAKDRLVVSDDTITVKGLILRKGERFAIKVNNVDLFERTGEFRWAVTLDGTALRDADNPPMEVVGTTQGDVAFEIVDDTGAPISAPEYNAASLASIRFRFTAENTVIQPGGTLRFTVPFEWSQPSVTDRANRATVSIVHLDDDGNETFVDKVADKWALRARGRDVTLTIDPKGKLDPGSSVIIRYGTPDTKYPVKISESVRGTAGSDADGLSIRGYFKVSSATGFPERDAGRVWVDITNVKDGTGTVKVTPPSVRASSTDNLIRVVYTAIGTMDGGAVRITIPQNWGLPQNDDAEKPNYVNVTVSSGAKLTSEVLHDDGRFVQANLTTLGAGDNVSFTYGGGRGANRGAVAQADLGDAVFLVESRGSSGGTFEAIVDNMDKAISPIVEVKSARSGSGTVALAITNNKSGSVVYDGVAERRIFAGDDKTYLVLTYTAEQTIAEGQLKLIVPSGWTAPQEENTDRPGYTEIEDGNALVSNEEYNGQSVTATIEMDRGDVIKIHYGRYTTEDGGAHAPQAPGTYLFRVEFDRVGVASQPSVIVHGGTASKLVVTAPSSVSADAGTAPVAITVEIQDDTGSAAVMGSDLEVTLSSTSSTGSFTDANGDAIAGNKVPISAGSTEATAYYSDTGAGTTATVRAMAVGLDSGRATIEVTSDIDTVDASSISVSPAMVKAGDRVTVTARGTAGKTATLVVGDFVNKNMTESPAGSYSGNFTVVQNLQDGTHNVTVTIGEASAMVANAVTIDTTAPTISSASVAPSTVGNGDMVTISATVTGATSVTADVSGLDDTKTDVTLTMANGSYSASVTISDDNAALNGSKTITVTAMDAVGNSARSTATVELDNKLSYTSMIPAGTVLFHVPLDVDGLDTVGDLKAKIGSAVSQAIVIDAVSGPNARADDVAITAGLGIILTMSAEASVTFEGDAWGGGTSSLSLTVGSNNLVGLGVNDSRVTNVSDIMGLFPAGTVASITVSTGANEFTAVTAAGAAGDGPVMGDAAYLVTATSAATVALIGKGWENGGTAAAPIALAGYNVDGQTAVLDVSGAVVDEITGLASEGFRVKVKNLSTKTALSKVTSAEVVDGYNMTFVDLKAGNAARIGDVLEISADSPHPLIGVKPVRHIVTVDDVKNSLVTLENLIAYEIPAETELLRNYPNPFNPETWIPYHLSEDADVKLTIYSVTGEVVRDIDVGHQTAAKYDTRSKAIYWDGRNQFGEQVASGIYFYSLSAGDFSATRKMVILK